MSKITAKERLLQRLNSMSTDDQKEFAARCETTVGQLRQICYGNRPCSVIVAVHVDRETGGEVSMEEMSPRVDWNHVRKAMRRRK